LDSAKIDALRGLGVFAVKKILLISLVLLVSCAPAQVADFPPMSNGTVVPSIEPTSTIQPSPEKIFTTIPEASTPPPPITPTNMPIPCDPFTAEFCITDGHFLLRRPILPPANDSVDRAYPYASTDNGTRDPHHGVEFLNKFGTPIHAAADGIVQFAGPDNEAIYSPWRDYYGNVVVIRHEDDLFTLYAHLSAIDVESGQKLKAGEKIGEVGQSGVAIGSHLHFEVRRGDGYFATVNPELWLVPREDENGVRLGALMISVMDVSSRFISSNLTLQYYPEKNQPPAATHYIVIYHSKLTTGDENAALGDLPAGTYRLALIYNGQVHERWVEVESGKLTQVVFVVK
jgi:hypothetical protein